jgi:F-type H+-transporting ATPase subunit gamma
MAQGIRELKRRIKSIGNTKAITKAMQAVAASKMKKAQDHALEARPFALKALELLSHVQEGVSNYSHPLLEVRTPKKVAIIIFTSDKGLCGSLNTNTIKQALHTIEEYKGKADVELVVIGKKGTDFFKRVGIDIVAQFSALSDKSNVAEITPISKIALDDFSNKTYDEILLVYPNFISTVIQQPQTKKILPLTKEIVKDIAELSKEEIKLEKARAKDFEFEYDLEPSPEKLLNALLPRLVEMQIYHAQLETNASEHSARMISMKNATDNASDILDDLNLTYNQVRQSGITKEISEIAAGVEALKDIDE